MNENSYGVTLYDAEDVLPLGLVGTPWEIIFKALRDVLKSGVGASDSDFMRKACALYFLARGDLEAVTDRDVLNGIAAALVIPYWVENFDDPAQASAIIYNWIKYKPTRPNLTALALASGMRAFHLRETYTSTEYGLSHSFGFDLGEGYDTSFFAGPNATPGLETAQRICGALTHFFLRIKDSPTLITDITYPEALPHGAQFYFRPDQSEIRILQGYNWDLYDENGELAKKIDEYAYYIPSVTRNSYGVNTEIVPPTHLIFLSDGQIRVSWEQSPTSAYALFAEVGINIPDKTRGWLSISHVDVNLPPNAIPGATLFDEEGDPITGEGWEIFAAYNQALDRLDTSGLYLAGTDPVRIRADRYMTVCQVWLSYNPPPPPPLDDRTTFIVVDTNTGEIVNSIIDEGMVYGDVGYVLMDDAQMITVYETGVRTESFYFTTNGRNETANTNISHADIPVYLEDGTAPAADTPYDGSSVLAFMDVTGNTKQADGESLYLDDGVLRLDAPDTDEGEQWAALVEYIDPTPPLPGDDPAKPLTFKATSDGSSVKMSKSGSPSGTFEYSTDGGVTWAAYTIDTDISLNNGDSVSFRAATDRTIALTQTNYFQFAMSGTIEAYHNVMSVLYHSDYENKLSLPIVRALYRLFSLCTSLTRAPLLPATTLTSRCYDHMFFSCTSLAQAPALPATTLADYCYDHMFNGCSSLVQAPALPATTLANYCYQYMFYECASLVQAPALPATTLASYCYRSMFASCSLVQAPDLPAEAVPNYAYNAMFRENYGLNYVKCHATSFGTSAVESWLVHVSATGDFYANPSTTWADGTSGIPSGWNRHDIV